MLCLTLLENRQESVAYKKNMSFSAKLAFSLHQLSPNEPSFNSVGNNPSCKTGVTLPLTSNCTVIHSRFVINVSSHQCTFLRASFYESVPVISSTASCLPLGSFKTLVQSSLLLSFDFPSLSSRLAFALPRNTPSSFLLCGLNGSSCSSS